MAWTRRSVPMLVEELLAERRAAAASE